MPVVCGRVVHWIDSKAEFGDRYWHRAHRDQMNGYITRFGPGMVIYWYGHLTGLDDYGGALLIRCRFPLEAGAVQHPAALESVQASDSALFVDFRSQLGGSDTDTGDDVSLLRDFRAKFLQT